MHIKVNINPIERRGDDCVVRAISTIENEKWENVYMDLCIYGLKFYDMPSSNHVWGAYLMDKGYTRHIIPNTCPQCYTVEQFAKEHPKGRYILALHGHVVPIINGDYYDTWDSGWEIPVYYWKKGD